MSLLSAPSPRKSLDDLEVARVLVDVDGAELTGAGEDAIVSRVEVKLEVDRPGSFLVELSDLSPEDLEWIDEGTVQEGRPVTIKMGFGEAAAPVFAGEVTGLELDASDPGGAQVTIRGYDRLHRLARARRTRAFVGRRDSQIVSDLASAHDLLASCEDTGVVHAYVMQRGQTDLAFLRERARRIGYFVRVEADQLLFQPRGLADAEVVTAELGDNLLELFVSTSILGQVGAAEARGWLPDEQKEIVEQVATPRSTMGGSKTGLEVADELYRAEITAVTGVPIVDERSAELAASAELERLALSHVTCSGRLLGTANLRPGAVLAVAGMGKRFSGPYWLTQVVHTWDAEGFFTRFEGRRTAT